MLQYPCSPSTSFWEQKIKEAANAGADIVVMPELFFGLDFPPIQQWAQQYQVALVGSCVYLEEGAEKPCNWAFFCQPDGTLEGAGKRHLFAWEKLKFEPGQKRLQVEYRGWKICVLVCFDVRFPVWSRNQSGWDYDLLIYVANFPQERTHEWDLLLQARSIENQAYVCGTNRTGSDRNDTQYDGHSAVYLGAALASPEKPDCQQAPITTDGTLYADLDLERVYERRNIFQAWKSTDSFNIN